MPKIKVFKNWTLMSPGMANGIYYPSEAINLAFKNTQWDKKTQSLSMDHMPNQVSTNAGDVRNIHVSSNGDLKGDIHVYDLNTINKLESGARYGISPELDGFEEGGEMKDFKFLNFSVVFEPAVKTTYLNSKSEGQRKHIKTNYLLDNQFKESEILIEQAIDPAISRFCFVDNEGNICRHRPQNRIILNMEEDVKKPEEEVKDEAKPEEKGESKEELSEIKELLTKVLKDNQELKEEVKKKYPYPKEEAEEPEEEPKKEKKKEPKLRDEDEEETKPAETPEDTEASRQMLGEALSEEILEALSVVNSEYTDFVKAYMSKHKGEGTIGELMKKAAKEWKSKKSVKEEEDKQALKEQRETVTQTEGKSAKKELSEQEMDSEVASFFLDQQETFSQKVI